MTMKTSLIIIFFFFFSSINAQNNNDAVKIKKIISNKSFEYKTGTIIGYEKSEDGPGFVSAHFVILKDNYVYIGDNVNKNIKRIYIKTGAIIQNDKNIIKKHNNIMEAGIINNHLFIVTMRGNLYEFNEELKLLKIHKVPCMWTSDIYLFYSDTDKLEFKGFVGSPKMQIVNISKDYKVTFDSIIVNENKYSDELDDRRNNYNMNKKYYQFKKDNKFYLTTDLGTFELLKEIPIDNEDLRNLDFDAKRIVYFTISPQKMTLHVLEYE